jgi:hypothetical protein
MQLLSRLLPSTLYLVVSCFIDNSLFILTVLFSTFSCSSVTTSHVFKQRNPSVGFLSLISSLIPIQTYLQTPCFVPKPSCLSNSTPEHFRSTPSGLALGNLYQTPDFIEYYIHLFFYYSVPLRPTSIPIRPSCERSFLNPSSELSDLPGFTSDFSGLRLSSLLARP